MITVEESQAFSVALASCLEKQLEDLTFNTYFFQPWIGRFCFFAPSCIIHRNLFFKL